MNTCSSSSNAETELGKLGDYLKKLLDFIENANEDLNKSDISSREALLKAINDIKKNMNFDDLINKTLSDADKILYKDEILEARKSIKEITEQIGKSKGFIEDTIIRIGDNQAAIGHLGTKLGVIGKSLDAIKIITMAQKVYLLGTMNLF